MLVVLPKTAKQAALSVWSLFVPGVELLQPHYGLSSLPKISTLTVKTTLGSDLPVKSFHPIPKVSAERLAGEFLSKPAGLSFQDAHKRVPVSLEAQDPFPDPCPAVGPALPRFICSRIFL